jgi:hypothetical protein
MARKVEVDIKTRGADKASRDLGKVDKGLGRLAKSAGIAAASFFGARMLLDGFRSVINATKEQILAETQLNAVLKSTAGVAGLTAKELTGMASALQKQTRFGDEAIIKAQSLLLTFTKVGKEVFPDALEAVLNMSEAMGQDLQQGVIQVGKALNDPILGVTALRRVGVQLSKQQEDLVKHFTKTGEVAKAQKIILSELETQFGGTAKAAGETMAGSLDQMSNAAGDAAESIGKLLEGPITDFANKMTEVLEAVSRATEGKGFIEYILSGPKGSLKMLGIDLDKVKVSVKDLMQNLDTEVPDLSVRFGLTELPNVQASYNEHLEKMAAFDNNALEVRMGGLEDEFVRRQAFNKQVEQEMKEQRKAAKEAHKEKIAQNLEAAILQGQSAKQAGISVVKAEVVEAQAGLISSIMKSLPFPINLAVAAGAGGMIGKVTDSLFSSFATGGSFVTKGRTTLPIGNGVVVGDNASGMERVDVTPLPSPTSNGNNITINISAPLVDETVVDHIIPAIRRAEKLNL